MTTTPQAALLSDAYAQGIEAAASLLTRMADEYALTHGHDDMGALSFGGGKNAEARMEWHSSLIELAEEIRRLDGAKLQATQEPVQAGWAQSGSGDTLARPGSIIGAPAEINPEITQNRQGPVQAGELPDEREAFEAWARSQGANVEDLRNHRWACGRWDGWQARAALSARKPLMPLSSKQVKELAASVGYYDASAQEKADFINGIRHGERAHGIGAIGLEVKP